MSRIGKIPVTIPKGAKVEVGGGRINVEGPKGKLNLTLPEGITAQVAQEKVAISRQNDIKQSRANHGTVRARLVSMLEGVTTGHKKELEIQGLGFRGQAQGQKIAFILGFSHPVEYHVHKDVKVSMPTQTSIILESSDAMLLGQTAAQIRALKPVEPYKGKGIRYVGEKVRRKQGKSVTK